MSTVTEPLASPNDAHPGALRGIAWAAALVLILGSVLFLAGGRTHPGISVAIGAGPEDFFRAFAEKVQHTDGWHAMHMLILVGPLCWAVAAPALLDAIYPAAHRITGVARSALLLSGALWAVAFVLDGFGAPVYASALVAPGTATVDAAVMAAFEANAIMMSRLGLVSWVAGGLGIVLLASSLLPRTARTPWRIVVGVSGILIGAWPLLAALEGEYAGGPFTSQYWMANALLVGLWYVALASCGFRARRAAA